MKVEQALEFLNDGWSIFPVGPDKRPLLASWKEFQERFATEEEVKWWWLSYPDANVGLVCGKLSGRSVIDIDNGEDIFPETRTVKTPRGGLHKIYRYSPIPNTSAGTYYKGIDLRNDGGYIVAAGSHIDYLKDGERVTGDYVLIDDVPSAPFPDALFTAKTEKTDSFDPKRLLGSNMGSRNEWAASVIGLLVSGKPKDIAVPLWELTKAWNTKNQPPLDEQELLTVFNSITKKEWAKPKKETQLIDGLSITKESRAYTTMVPLPSGTVKIIFSEISRSRQSFETILNVQLKHNEDGLMPAFEQRIDLNSASAVSNLATALNSAYGNKKEGYNWVLILNKAANAIKKLLASEKKPLAINGQEFTEEVFLLKPFLEKGTSTMLFGDGSTGKTYFALLMVATSHLGRTFFGHQTQKIKTLFLDYEDTYNGFVNRMHYIANGMGVSITDIQDSIQYYKPEGSLRDESEIIAKMVEDGRYDLIIIDAGADATGGSPMDEKAVLDMFNALNRIDCTKLIIHHEPKKTEGLDADKSYYGTTYWRNRVRLSWRLSTESQESPTKKVVKAAMTKANNMAKIEPFMYTMEFLNDSRSVVVTEESDWKPSDNQKVLNVLMDGEATESTIIDGAGLTRTSAQRVINDLMEQGKIERKRDGKKYVYFIQN